MSPDDTNTVAGDAVATTPSTVGDLVKDATLRFTLAGIDTPRLDADLLVSHALGRDRAWLLGHMGDELSGDHAAIVEALVSRRESREPVAYIMGTAGFRRLELQVDERVLVPRPETELLVELAIDRIIRRAADGPAAPARVLDLCTGSGAVALAIADESPLPVEVVAIDLSPGAVAVARANASRLELTAKVDVQLGDLFEQLPIDTAPFDVIVANPPYVDRADREGLMPDVRDFEPEVALFAPDGQDPLSIALDIVAHAPAWLTPGALLALEIGHGQAMRLAGAMRQREFDAVHTVPDLSGIERIVAGRWGS